MILSQYKILLPSDYDMKIIKERVRNNGHKTDGFKDLKFKVYLITEKGENNNTENSYCPLYFWNSHNGLNKFLFRGFYDNILHSFGWQKIDISIPLLNNIDSQFKHASHLFHVSRKIEKQAQLVNFNENILKSIPNIHDSEYLLSYNPEKWEYDVFYFLNDTSLVKKYQGTLYSILHISEG